MDNIIQETWNERLSKVDWAATTVNCQQQEQSHHLVDNKKFQSSFDVSILMFYVSYLKVFLLLYAKTYKNWYNFYETRNTMSNTCLFHPTAPLSPVKEKSEWNNSSSSSWVSLGFTMITNGKKFTCSFLLFRVFPPAAEVLFCILFIMSSFFHNYYSLLSLP